MEKFCEIDGKYLKYISDQAVTEEIINLAIENGFDIQEDLKDSRIRKSIKAMEYFINIDPQLVEYCTKESINYDLFVKYIEIIH